MALFDNPFHTCDIEKPAPGTDPGAGTSLTYSPRTASVPGIFSVASASESEIFSQPNMQVTAKFVTRDTSAQRGDRVLYNGVYYRVVGIVTNQAAGNIPTLNALMLSALG